MRGADEFSTQRSRVNQVLKHPRYKTFIEVGGNLMPVHRKRFRIEEINRGDMPMVEIADDEAMPMHREIMSELKAIREQMASPHRAMAAETLRSAS